ncbi:MAG: D-alanyl-D-alanine carboxypeptidase [Deltaproteobacteria bacterium]|nr:D-alanyl-D-alanine carboxypeptidase [Deltaproteobacteria bacterium]
MKATVAVSVFVMLLAAGGAGAAVAPSPAAVPGAKANKYAAVVVDSDSGVVLYERNADFSRYPASLTKMMTLYLTFDALKAGRIKLTDKLAVSEHAASRDPSRLGLRPGSTLQLEDAIEAMTTKSANDAASVVAEAVAKGSESRFAEMMTAKAHDLGMKRSTFRNASGLPEGGHVSSALDMAILARALVHDFPEYYHFFSVSHFDFGGKRYPSQNRFLRTYPGADGLKTGYIDSSGHNLAASASRGGKRLITVVLGGDTARWTREYASQLLDTAYAGIDPKLVVVASAQKATTGAVAAAATVSAATAGPIATATASAAGAVGVAVAATATAAVTSAATAPPATAPSATAPAVAMATTAQPATTAAANPEPIPSPSRSTATETLLAAAQPSKPASEAAKKPDAAATKADEAALRARAWSVQVGLYRDRAVAERRGKEARERVPGPLGKAPLMMAGYGSDVSPRFGGLTEADARQACTQLQRASLPCVVVPPGRALIIATN